MTVFIVFNCNDGYTYDVMGVFITEKAANDYIREMDIFITSKIEEWEVEE